VADNIPEGRRKITRTSGSSGEPFAFWADRASDPPRMLAWYLLQYWAGIPPNCTQVWFAGPRASGELPPESWIPASDVRPGKIEAILERMVARAPYYLYGYTSAIAALAQHVLMEKAPLTAMPQAVVVTSETLTEDQAVAIQRAFGRRAINRYGSHEFGGAAAQSCPDHPPGLHFIPHLVLPEVVRDEGTPVIPGERGRLILTDLTNFVFPFIRYDIGDVAVAGDCTCGRSWPAVASIEGRTSEMLRLANGHVVGPTELGQLLFAAHDLLPHVRAYQLVQLGENHIELRLIPTEEYSAQVEKEIVKILESWLDASATALRVTVRTVESIPTEPSGKRLSIKRLPGQTKEAVEGLS